MNFYHKSVRDLIRGVREKKISCGRAFKSLKGLPYIDMGFAKLDTHRPLRKGFCEAIYARGKSPQHLEKITARHLKDGCDVILTKADSRVYDALRRKHPQLKYNRAAGIVYFQAKTPPAKKGFISVVTAGTSDIGAAEEAALMLELMGDRVRRFYDVGVAGIHRVIDKVPALNKSRAVIVVAGMEGALVSVIAGLVNKPVIAVPTSVGYGASFKGIAPLLTMLNCCAPGVAVVNIDNGFGAACFADMIK